MPASEGLLNAAISTEMVLISCMPGTGCEQRDEAGHINRDNGRRNTGRVTTR